VVQRREDAGDVEGLVIGGRIGRAEAELLGRVAHGAEDRDRVHLHHAHAVAHGLGVVAAQDVGHGEAVVEEGHVEAAILEDARDALVVLRLEIVLHRLGVPPGAGIVRAILRLEEGDQGHFAAS
jgi:hypothetical protein